MYKIILFIILFELKDDKGPKIEEIEETKEIVNSAKRLEKPWFGKKY